MPRVQPAWAPTCESVPVTEKLGLGGSILQDRRVTMNGQEIPSDMQWVSATEGISPNCGIKHLVLN